MLLELIAGLTMEQVKLALDKNGATLFDKATLQQKGGSNSQIQWRLLALAMLVMRMRKATNFDELKLQNPPDRRMLAQAFELTNEIARIKVRFRSNHVIQILK